MAFDDLRKKLSGDEQPADNQPGFLRRLAQATIGDEKPAPGDESVRSSMSPLDFPMELGGLAAGGIKTLAGAAPRLVGNEIGAVGRNVRPLGAQSMMVNEAALKDTMANPRLLKNTAAEAAAPAEQAAGGRFQVNNQAIQEAMPNPDLLKNYPRSPASSIGGGQFQEAPDFNALMEKLKRQR